MRAGVRAGEARALVPQRHLLASCEAGGLHAGCFTSSALAAGRLASCSGSGDQVLFREGDLPALRCLPDAEHSRTQEARSLKQIDRSRSETSHVHPLFLAGAAAFCRQPARAWPTMRARRWWTSRHASARSNRAAGPARGTTPAYSRDLPPMPIAAASPANALSTGGRRARWTAEDRSASARPATCSRPL